MRPASWTGASYIRSRGIIHRLAGGLEPRVVRRPVRDRASLEGYAAAREEGARVHLHHHSPLCARQACVVPVDPARTPRLLEFQTERESLGNRTCMHLRASRDITEELCSPPVQVSTLSCRFVLRGDKMPNEIKTTRACDPSCRPANPETCVRRHMWLWRITAVFCATRGGWHASGEQRGP
jgi:hypothetical protein